DLPVTASPPKFSQLRFGGLSKRPSFGGPVLVDNIRLEVVTVEPAAMPTTVEKAPVEEPTSAPPVAQTPQPVVAATPVGKTVPEPQASLASSPSPAVNNSSPAANHPSNPIVAESSTVAAAWWICGALGVIIVLLARLMIMLKRQGAVTS